MGRNRDAHASDDGEYEQGNAAGNGMFLIRHGGFPPYDCVIFGGIFPGLGMQDAEYPAQIATGIQGVTAPGFFHIFVSLQCKRGARKSAPVKWVVLFIFYSFRVTLSGQ